MNMQTTSNTQANPAPQPCPECAAPMRIVSAEFTARKREIIYACHNRTCQMRHVHRSSVDLCAP